MGSSSADNAASVGILHHSDQPILPSRLVYKLGKDKSFRRQEIVFDPLGSTPNSVNSVKEEQEREVEVVGPTAEELDSFNELIRFDHMYYKVPSDSLTPTEPTVNITSADTQDQSNISATNSDTLTTKSQLFGGKGKLGEDESVGDELLSEVLSLSDVLEQLINGDVDDDLLNSTSEIPQIVFDNPDDSFFSEVLGLDNFQPSSLSPESSDALSEQDCPSPSAASSHSCTPSPSSGYESIPENLFEFHDELVDMTMEVQSPLSSFSSSCEMTNIFDFETGSNTDKSETTCNVPNYCSSPVASPSDFLQNDNCSLFHPDIFNDHIKSPWTESFTDLFPSLAY